MRQNIWRKLVPCPRFGIRLRRWGLEFRVGTIAIWSGDDKSGRPLPYRVYVGIWPIEDSTSWAMLDRVCPLAAPLSALA